MATYTEQSEYNIINRKIIEKLNIELMDESEINSTYLKILDKNINIIINDEIYLSPKKVKEEVSFINFETLEDIEGLEEPQLVDLGKTILAGSAFQYKLYRICEKTSQQLLDNSFQEIINIIQELDFELLLKNIPVPCKQDITKISKSKILSDIGTLADLHNDFFLNKKRYVRLKIDHHLKCLLQQTVNTSKENPFFEEFTNSMVIETILTYILQHNRTDRKLVLKILDNIILTIQQNFQDKDVILKHQIFKNMIGLKDIYPKINTAKTLKMTYNEAKKYISKSNKNFTKDMYQNFKPLNIKIFYKLFIPSYTL